MAKPQKSFPSPALLKRQVADPSDDYVKYGYLGRTSQNSASRFLQGIFPFVGEGYDCPVSLSETFDYEVPLRKRAQLIYFRAGNSSSEMIDLLIHRNDEIMRHFPVGAFETIHIPLGVVEDLDAQTKIRMTLAAPQGVEGAIILDIGFLEL